MTERDLVRLGREARNCLADRTHGPNYRRALRRGASEFWRLDHSDHGLLCIAEVGRVRPRTLEQAEGPEGAPLSAVGAASLLEFLRRRDVRVGTAAEHLARHGICDEFVAAPDEPDRLDTVLGGNPWRLAVVPGAVMGMCARTGEAWLLRSAPKGVGARPLSCLAGPDDLDADEEPSYAYEARLRQGLRRTCREDAALARACADAFVEAPEWFREDWFGIKLSAPGAGR